MSNVIQPRPFKRAVAITLSDSTTYADNSATQTQTATGQDALEESNEMPDAIIVSTAGIVAVVDGNGNTALIGCAVGIPVFIRATKFKSTGSTASGVVGLFY